MLHLSETKDAGDFSAAVSVCLATFADMQTSGAALVFRNLLRCMSHFVMASNPADRGEGELLESKCEGLMEAEGDGYLGRAHQGESHSVEEIDNMGCLCCSFSRVVFTSSPLSNWK